MLRRHRLEQSCLIRIRTADSLTSFRSQLKTYMFARRSAVGASDTVTSLSRVINSLLTYLLAADLNWSCTLLEDGSVSDEINLVSDEDDDRPLMDRCVGRHRLTLDVVFSSYLVQPVNSGAE